MDVDPATVPATGGLDLWAACEERAVVRLTLASGPVLTGHYTSRVGLQHFLHRTGRDLPLIGEVTGPYGPWLSRSCGPAPRCSPTFTSACTTSACQVASL